MSSIKMDIFYSKITTSGESITTLWLAVVLAEANVALFKLVSCLSVAECSLDSNKLTLPSQNALTVEQKC